MVNETKITWNELNETVTNKNIPKIKQSYYFRTHCNKIRQNKLKWHLKQHGKWNESKIISMKWTNKNESVKFLQNFKWNEMKSKTFDITHVQSLHSRDWSQLIWQPKRNKIVVIAWLKYAANIFATKNVIECAESNYRRKKY